MVKVLKDSNYTVLRTLIENLDTVKYPNRYALVIARFRVQYDQFFPSFSYFADLFHGPLGGRNNSRISETRKTLAILCKISVR